MTQLGYSRKTNLQTLLDALLDQRLSNLHTCMPGRVEKYYPDDQSADIKPLQQRIVIDIDGSETVESLPVIPKVPIGYSRNDDYFISFPLKKGSLVLLVFCERSIDKYTSGSGIDTNPVDLRQHDLSDAVAIPMFYPFQKSLRDVHSDNMVIGRDKNGIQIHITPDDEIEIKYGGGTVFKASNKDGDATFTVGDGAMSVIIAEVFEKFWNTFVTTIFNLHTHICAAPASPSAPPLPTASTLPSNTISTKVTIPNG